MNIINQFPRVINEGGSSTDVTLETLGVTATADELNYVDGVTGNIQTQLDSKADVMYVQVDEPTVSVEKTVWIGVEE